MLPWLSSLTVGPVLEERLRHWWSFKDYRISLLPLKYPLPQPVPSLTVYPEFVWLSQTIYPSIYQTGYGRFRPNKIGYHSGCGYYRGGLCLATASQIFATAADGTRLTQPLLPELFRLGNSLR